MQMARISSSISECFVRGARYLDNSNSVISYYFYSSECMIDCAEGPLNQTPLFGRD